MADADPGDMELDEGAAAGEFLPMTANTYLSDPGVCESRQSPHTVCFTSPLKASLLTQTRGHCFCRCTADSA